MSSKNMNVSSEEEINRTVFALLDSSPDLISAVNSSMSLIYFNNAYSITFGELYGAKPTLGSHISKVYKGFPEIFKKASARWERALQGEPFTHEFEIYHPSKKSTIYFEAKFAPLYNDNQTIIGASQSVREVTDKVLREKEAKEASSKLEGIIDSSKNCIVSVNNDLELITINNCAKVKMRQIFDVDLVLGQKLTDVIANEKFAIIIDQLSLSLKGDVSELKITIPKTESSEKSFWDIDFRPLLLSNKNIIGATLTAREVTEAVNDKKQIKRNSDFIEGVINGAITAIGVFNSDYQLIKCNKTFVKYFQRVNVDLKEGDNLSEVLEYEQMRINFMAAGERALNGESISVQRTYPTLKNGKEMHADLSYSPIIQSDGEITGFTLSILDISDKVEKEKEVVNQSEFLKGVVSGALNAMAIFNDKFELVGFNKLFADDYRKHLDYNPIIGDCILDKISDQSLMDSISTSGERALKGEYVNFVREFKSSFDLEDYSIEVNYSPISNSEGLIIGFVLSNRDVTDRVKGQKELLKSAYLLKAVMNGNKDAMAVYDANFKLLQCNDIYIQGFIDSSKVELKVGDNVLEKLKAVPHFHQNLLDRGTKALKGEHHSYFGDYYQARLEKQMQFEIVYAPILDSKDKIIGFYQSNRDISNQVANDKKLKDAAKLLKGVMNGSQDAMAVFDTDFKLIECDDYYSRVINDYCNYAPKPGDKILEHIQHSKELYHNLKSRGERALQGESLTFERSYFDKFEQGIVHLNISYNPVISDSGKIIGFSQSNRDVTEKVLAEQKNTKNAILLEALFDHEYLAYWQVDMNEQKQYTSQSYLQMFGYSLSDEAKEFSFWREQMHPDDLIKSDEAFIAHVESGAKKQFGLDIRMKHKKGHWVWINFTGRVTEWNEDGSPKMISGTNVNITERVNRRRELAEESSKLQSIINGVAEKVVSIDNDQNVINFNEAYGRHFKSRFGVELNIGDNLLEKLKGEDLENMNLTPFWKKAISGEKIRHSFSTKVDDEIKYYEASFTPIITSEAEQIGSTLVLRNITIQKTAEIEIMESALQLKSIIDGTNDYIVAIDNNKKFIAFNKAYSDFFKSRFGVELKKGVTLKDLVSAKHFKGVSHMSAFWERALKGETFEAIQEVKDKQNTRTIKLSFNAIRNADNEVIGAAQSATDITDSLRYEEKLKKSADTIQGVLDGSEDIISAVDKDLKFIAFNKLFATEVETLYEMKVALGQSLQESLAHKPEELKKALEFYQLALQGETVKYTRETKGINQVSFYYDITYLPMYSPEGEVIGASHIVKDVSEHMRQNVELEIAGAKLQGIMDGQSDGVAALDKSYNYLAFNKAYSDLINSSIGKLPQIGQNIKELFNDSAIPSNKSNWERWDSALAGEHVQTEVKYPKNGELSDFVLNYTPVKDSENNTIGAVQVVHDVTQERLIEAEVKTSATRLKAIIDGSVDIIASIDKDFRITAFNKAYSDMVYQFYQKPVQHGDSFREILKDYPEHFERVKTHWSKALGGESFIVHSNQTDEKGNKRFFEAQYNPVKDSEGVVLGAVHIIHDITTQKLAEATLKESKDQLEIKVNQRTEELTKTNYDLKRINNYFDTYLYTAAHDLRSPIINIKQFMGLLGRIQDQKKRDAILGKIDVSVNRLEKTVQGLNQVLDVQKSEHLDYELCSFNDAINGVLVQMEHIIEDSKAEVIIDVQADEFFYIPAYLNSIVFNLLSNAIKYKHNDRDPVISISTSKDPNSKGCYVLRIQDNGMGMDLEKHGENLFAPFKRLTTEREGLGVGLNILKSIIEKNGGTIEVESQVGEGSVFKAYLKCYKTGNTNFDC